MTEGNNCRSIQGCPGRPISPLPTIPAVRRLPLGPGRQHPGRRRNQGDASLLPGCLLRLLRCRVLFTIRFAAAAAAQQRRRSRSPSPTSNRHALAPAVPLRPELPSAASGLQRPPWPAALPASGRAGGPVLSSGSVAGAIVLVRAEPTLSETPFRLHSPASLSVFSAIWSAG